MLSFALSAALKGALMVTVSFHSHYVTQPGDSLSSIAAAQGTSWQAIYAANRSVIGANPDYIRPGEVLTVRGGSQASPAPAGDHEPDGDSDDPAAAPAGAPQSSVSAAPGSFQACVIARQSSGNPQAQSPSSTASGLYGFIDSTWTAVTGLPGPARDYSVAQQTAAFNKLYAQAGEAPWAVDGC